MSEHDEHLGGDESLDQKVKNILHEELSHFLDDVEFRLAQTREHERRIGAMAVSEDGVVATKIYAEDIHIGRHQITGYTVTANSPTAGSIAWASLHVVYNGVDYTAANGNTALKYVWFVKPATGTTVALSTSATKPVLGATDCLVFVNNGGTPVSALEASIPVAIGDGAVDSTAILDGAVTPTKTSFYTTLAAAVTAAQSAADLAQATADGSIATYFQSAAPWANGTTQPDGKVGDVWYDSDDGQAYRWSGAAGTPANTWVAISDSDIGAALAAAAAAQATANTKITTYYSGTAPTAPTGGFTTGDYWVDTANGNLTKRWSGAAWVSLPVGTGAIADDAVTNAKIGPLAVTDTELQTGAVTATKIGNGAVVAAALGAGAVTPVKLNTLQHVLY